MATFSVHTRGAPYSDIKLVREGFSLTAFVFGPFWFAFQRAWLGLAAWAAGILAIVALAVAVGAPPLPVAGGVVAFMLLMAMEACQFRRRSLARRGFKLADVVEASRRHEADIRFLARSFSDRSQSGAAPGVSRPSSQRVENVGLFLNGA